MRRMHSIVIGAAVASCLSACTSHWPEASVDAGTDDTTLPGDAPPDAPQDFLGGMAPPAAGAGGFADAPFQPPPGAGGFGGAPSMGPPPDGTFVPFPFTDQERELFASLSPLGALPEDTTNGVADDPLAAELGQKLFFDPRYSGPLKVDSDLGGVAERGRVACASCHWGEYLDDQREGLEGVSVGADFHTRNALPLINSAFYRWTNWGGRFAAQWELSLAVAESGVIMNGSRLAVAHLVFDQYRSDYETVFGPLEPVLGDTVRFPPEGKPMDPAWDLMAPADQLIVNQVFVNFGKALQAYLRQLVTRSSPFDRFVAGDELAIAESAKRGLALFVGRARCVSCHLGPNFTDDAFHNTGVPQIGAHVPPIDEGRAGDIPKLLSSPFNVDSMYSDDARSGRLAGLTDPPPAETLGQFRTPSLRSVGLTPPYMHSGQYATLGDVLDFYDRGGEAPVVGQKDPRLVPLHLSGQDKVDLVEFLFTLTGEPVPRELVEPPPELMQVDFQLPPADW